MIIQGNAKGLPLRDKSVQCVVTSPPYWGLRDYGTGKWEGGDDGCDHVSKNARKDADFNARTQERYGKHSAAMSVPEQIQYRATCGKCGAIRIDLQLGLEKTPQEYVEKMVEVFREVKRVLRDDGTIWVNLGDSYWNGGGEKRDGGHGFVDGGKIKLDMAKGALLQRKATNNLGLKPKDLVGIPWRVAFALQQDGWYLRSDIIWGKPNPMPESVTDRPTKAHEYLFLLAKSERYFFDQDAVRERYAPASFERWDQDIENQEGSSRVPGKTNGTMKAVGGPRSHKGSSFTKGKTGVNGSGRVSEAERADDPNGRNIRSVWTIATQPYSEAHFATFPEDLIKPCVLAGCPVGGVVLDPFVGSGTTVKVAQDLGRIGVGVDLKWEYLQMARKRSAQQGLRI